MPTLLCAQLRPDHPTAHRQGVASRDPQAQGESGWGRPPGLVRPPHSSGARSPQAPLLLPTAPGSTPRAQPGPTLPQFPATPAPGPVTPPLPGPGSASSQTGWGWSAPGQGYLRMRVWVVSAQIKEPYLASAPCPSHQPPVLPPSPTLPHPAPDASQAAQHSPDPQPCRARSPRRP